MQAARGDLGLGKEEELEVVVVVEMEVISTILKQDNIPANTK